MSLIIENNVLVVFQFESGWLGHGTEMHDGSTISIENPDISGLLNKSNSASDWWGMSHTSNAIEILAGILFVLNSEFIQLTRQESGSSNNDIVFSDLLNEMNESLFSIQRIAINNLILELIVSESLSLDN